MFHHQHSADQVAEMSAGDITNSPSQDYAHPDNHTSPTYDVGKRIREKVKCSI